MFNTHDGLVFNGGWSEVDLGAMSILSGINAERIGVPHLTRMLPIDLDRYIELVTLLRDGTNNILLTRLIMRMLSRDAVDMPAEIVAALLRAVQPALHDYGPFALELAAMAASHPSILRDLPLVREAIGGCDPADGTSVVAVLWQAAGAHPEEDRELLLELLEIVDRRMAAEPGLKFNVYFAPQFVTYLRVERPAYWLSADRRTYPFGNLGPYLLASIEPADAVYIAESWPIENDRFVDRYLTARGVRPTHPSTDPIALIRTYAEEQQEARDPSDPGPH
jgi:hypothetical protein